MTNEPKKRGRPRKQIIAPLDGETPATVVKPMPEPEENTNPVVVEEVDQAGEVIAGYADTGEAVELSPAQIVALDRDYDGDPGGSRPKASLTDLQRNAYIQDAEDAYQQQVEVKRTDGFNRVWTFRHVIVDNKDHMQLRVDRGPMYAERLISTAFYDPQAAESCIREIDAETER